MKRPAMMLAAVLAFGLLAWAQGGLLINGAGATFPYPMYSKWFDDVSQEVFQCQYQLPVNWVRRGNQASYRGHRRFWSYRRANER